HLLTATSSRPAPSAKRIDVTLGASETMRRMGREFFVAAMKFPILLSLAPVQTRKSTRRGWRTGRIASKAGAAPSEVLLVKVLDRVNVPFFSLFLCVAAGRRHHKRHTVGNRRRSKKTRRKGKSPARFLLFRVLTEPLRPSSAPASGSAT